MAPSINNYIDQLRFRVEEAERHFHDSVKALQSSQAANGLLRSGSTIAKTLRLFEDVFASLTNDIIAYLGKAVDRTTIPPTDLLDVTASILAQSLIAHKAIVDRDKLLSFAPGKGIADVIDQSFNRADQRLTLRLQEFRFGLDDAAPRAEAIAPAADRYVTIAHNQKEIVGDDLKELASAVRGDNEASEEDRMIALSEIAVFEATILAPVASTDLIDRFVKRILKWILATFSAAAVGKVAERLIEALATLR